MKPSPEKLLADLLWVVNSPSLIESDEEVTALAKSDVDLDRLVLFFDAGVPRRVGYYFERLVLFWLAHVRGVEMVANGMPIREGKITLGELDFLFRDELNRLTHLEVAVKFYLHHAETLIEGSHFVGPNLKDDYTAWWIFKAFTPPSNDFFASREVRRCTELCRDKRTRARMALRGRNPRRDIRVDSAPMVRQVLDGNTPVGDFRFCSLDAGVNA